LSARAPKDDRLLPHTASYRQHLLNGAALFCAEN